MTTLFFIKLFVELVLIALIGYGIVKEQELIQFEDDLMEVLEWCIENPDIAKSNIERNLKKWRS